MLFDNALSGLEISLSNFSSALPLLAFAPPHLRPALSELQNFPNIHAQDLYLKPPEKKHMLPRYPMGEQ
ncbi:hypothetical protein Q2406_18240 [Klebsiella pneumoniae]|nr:hypothetical protein [Klebsiella pneumoniae]